MQFSKVLSMATVVALTLADSLGFLATCKDCSITKEYLMACSWNDGPGDQGAAIDLRKAVGYDEKAENKLVFLPDLAGVSFVGHCDDLEVDFDSPEARINAKCDGKETEAWNLSAYVVYEGGRLVPK